MDNKEQISSYVIDNVEVTVDSDGTEHFKPIDTTISSSLSSEPDTRSWLQKLIDWWNGSPMTPYVKVRDLSDPLDRNDDDGSGHKKGIEIGIKVKF